MTARKVRLTLPTITGGKVNLLLPNLAALTPLPPVDVKKPRRRKAGGKS